ncbi:MAG: hypothetical protein J2P19_32805 [Pseudonocardia sp.]|nr:hypothetical protein [Pseudonocardia sp.]
MNARNAGIGADLDLPASVTQRTRSTTTSADLPMGSDADVLARTPRTYTTVEEDR